MITTMPILPRRGIVLVVLPCLLSSSSTTDAFRGGGNESGMRRIPPPPPLRWPSRPRHRRNRHGHNGAMNAPSSSSFSPSTTTAREYKYSSSLEEGERRRITRQIDAMSTTTTTSSYSAATAEERAPTSVSGSSTSSRSRGGAVVSTARSDANDYNGIDDAVRVLSASLLVTGNTVGSSMFVLPEAVGRVGLACGSALFLGLYLYNLISGLLLADVAITLHESSECDVPSSFKDFVDAALSSEVAGTLTSFLSLLSNGCFLAYGTIAAGPMLIDVLRPHVVDVAAGGVDPAIIGTCAFASAISLFAITQTNAGLERLANCVVFVVFASFAYLLVPSVGNVSDPLGTFLTPGTDVGGEGGYGDALASAVPLLLSSLMYQNIVPSVTKLLDFDRAKSTIAISIGSFIPMLMYVAWCYASLGGGLDVSTSSSAGSVALAAFSMSALFVSCLTAVMSLAEECEAIFSRRTTTASTVDDEGDCIAPSSRFSIPAVAASVIPPVGAALAFAGGGDVTSALHFNGAFIVPILYGILPTILYGGVRQLRVRDAALQSMNGLPQLLLGAGTICAIGQEIVQEVSCLQN